eukprot:TRINITY_DN21309_c0_g2_i9.p1 TRINITY_DN21309_c0_g2~~TRINITY_DN21309_c0_g2_i9.p1  ORF type:complete len:421 (+),score=66.76 TRINITY_DN21309_c0_g2_i9:53-1315(+)
MFSIWLVSNMAFQDKVVKEQEVYICNGALGSDSKIWLLQYPLRPTWRPYDVEFSDKARVKPNARKLEIEVDLDKQSTNFDNDVDPKRDMQKLVLQSTPVNQEIGLALGYVKDDKVFLVGINQMVQMRPSMAHVNQVEEQKRKSKEIEKEASNKQDSKSKRTKVQVQYKKRETEQEAKARLSSYAHLQQQEQQEEWVDLRCHSSESSTRAVLWEKLMQSRDVEPKCKAISKEKYLQLITPSGTAYKTQSVSVPLEDLNKPQNMEGVQEGATPPEEQGNTSQVQSFDSETNEALQLSFKELFKKNCVVNIQNVKDFLAQSKSHLSRACVSAPEELVHKALLMHKNIKFVRRVYIRTKLGHPQADPLHALIIKMLESKEMLKKKDIENAAKVEGVEISVKLFDKVIQNLCSQVKGQWQLKQGM